VSYDRDINYFIQMLDFAVAAKRRYERRIIGLYFTHLASLLRRAAGSIFLSPGQGQDLFVFETNLAILVILWNIIAVLQALV